LRPRAQPVAGAQVGLAATRAAALGPRLQKLAE